MQARSRLISAITVPQTPRFSGPVLGRAPLGAIRPREDRENSLCWTANSADVWVNCPLPELTNKERRRGT